MSTAWSRSTLGSLIDGLAAGVSVRSTSAPSGGPAVLKTSAVDRGRFVPDESKPILAVDVVRARCSVVGDSMILSRMNTPAMVGDVGYVERDYPNLLLPDRLWLARSRRGTGTDMRWLTYYFASEPGARRLRGIATGTSGSMKNIPKSRILALELDVPTPEEQRAVALALSDADNLIEALEGLIAKKQSIKQGMLQRLITGRTRLPGFHSAWTPLRAGDIGYFKGGSTFPPRFQGETAGAIPFFKVSDMNNEGNELYMRRSNNYITQGQRKILGSVVMPKGAIVFAKVGGAVFLERKRILAAASCIDNNMAAFVLDDGKAEIRFVHYALTMFPLASLVSTGALPSLNAGQLRSVPIALPSDLAEQREIAGVLADADYEIDKLKTRLAKASAVKTGMMQQLMTGRVRLPVGVGS